MGHAGQVSNWLVHNPLEGRPFARVTRAFLVLKQFYIVIGHVDNLRSPCF